jgi:hypothetical protein
VITLRTLVLAVFLIAWLATGIIAGVVMGRRHDRLLDRFLWSLLGAASGPLIVPLALGAERRADRPDWGEPPVLNDQAPTKHDIVHECGLGSFPASDPPSWWAAGSGQ